MIRCLIVDDELMAHQILEHYILQTPDCTLVAKCRNAIEALAMLEKHQIDCMFLDIEMPLINGLHFLKTLSVRPAVILTTAYAEHALEGYELDVVDYLLKPYSAARFNKALDKLRARRQQAPPQSSAPQVDHLLIKEKQGLMRLPHDQIISIEASRDYMKIISSSGQHLVHITMRQLEEQLPESHFIRVHKSYIVALSHVRLVRTDSLTLSTGAEIPVSANYKDRLLSQFKK